MTDPRTVEALTNLDDTTLVMAHGATVEPDYLMRALIATKERLNRHQPDSLMRICLHDGRRWPCADVRGDWQVLCVDEETP